MSDVALGLAAMDRPLEEFDDRKVTDAEAAKLYGVALSTWLEHKRVQPPLSMWRSDIARAARAYKTTPKGSRS